MCHASALAPKAKSTQAGVDMTTHYKAGDSVKLTGLPDWLLHDLPQDEQLELLTFVGQAATVTEVDAHGYIWLGFGSTIVSGEAANYSGHSFCVPPEFVQAV